MNIEELREYMQALINLEIKQTAEMYSYFAIQLGYVSLSKANRLEKMVETDEDYNWFVTVLAAVLSPVFIFKGRDWAVEGAEGLIHNCEDVFKDLINKQVEEVSRMLKALKLKVTDAPGFFQTQG